MLDSIYHKTLELLKNHTFLSLRNIEFCWLSFVLCFLVFVSLSICALTHIRTKDEVGTV